MKIIKYFFILMVLTLPSTGISQQSTSNKTDSIYSKPDQLPLYVGGEKAKLKFIESNLKYPQEAKQKYIEGKVIAEFIVEKDGSLTDLKIIRSLYPACDKEVLRLLSIMPKWNPGYYKKEAVRTRTLMTFYFILPQE